VGRLGDPDRRRQALDWCRVSREEEIGETLIGKLEERGLVGGDPERLQGGQGLGLPPHPPAQSIDGAQGPSPLVGALGPGIVLAVGQVQDADRGADPDRLMDESSHRQGLVVRMRGEQKESIRGLRREVHPVGIFGQGCRGSGAKHFLLWLPDCVPEPASRRVNGDDAPLSAVRS
jgi:hypothetical protein